MSRIKIIFAAIFILFFLLGYFGVHIQRWAPEDLYVGRADGPENGGLILILNVPYQPAERPFYCSEASTSMVLTYYGHEVSQEEVHEHSDRFELMIPFLSGFIDCELVENFGVDNLKTEILRGNPVMIRILPDKYRHTIVIVGYDESHLYAHDPDVGAFLKIDIEKLLEYWEPTNFGNHL